MLEDQDAPLNYLFLPISGKMRRFQNLRSVRMARVPLPFLLLRKFWRLKWADRWLVIETVVLLALARMMTLTMPFRRIAWLASRPIQDGNHSVVYRTAMVGRIRVAINRCAPYVPWRAMCFEQGLVAQILLRWHGVSSTLYYGAALDDTKGLSAHVWVQVGQMNVTGGEVAPKFAVLAAFPSPPDQFD